MTDKKKLLEDLDYFTRDGITLLECGRYNRLREAIESLEAGEAEVERLKAELNAVAPKPEQPVKWRPMVGDKVRVTKKAYQYIGVPKGSVGRISKDDKSDFPFAVEFPNGREHWFAEGELEPVEDPAPKPEPTITPEGRKVPVWRIECVTHTTSALLGLGTVRIASYWTDGPSITEPQPEPTKEQWQEAWVRTTPFVGRDWTFCRAVAREAYRLAREAK